MKQKKIIINGKFSLDAEELIKEYFSVKTGNGIEGFLVSDEDFVNRHQGTYAYKGLRSENYHSVYAVDKCDICWQPYDVIINDRTHLYNYLEATYKLCSNCKGFHYGLGEVLSMKLDGDIAS